MAIEKTINLNVNTKGAQKEVNNLEKAVEGVNEEVKETSASTEQMGGALDSATGGAITKFKGLKSGLKGVITSFKSLRVAIIATGIGALLIAVVALGQAFTRSEEGQNKFAKILAVIGSVVDNLLDVLANLGESIISVFENPKQALKDFTKLIKENIVNRFEGLLELFPKLGKAISLLFKGEFSAAGKVAADAVGKVTLGVDSITDSVGEAVEKVKEFGKEVAKDADNAAKIADARAKAEKMTRNLIVERAEAERKIAEIREKAADKENFTAAQRIELLKEAGAISEDLANKETEVAKLRLDAKVLENSLAKSNKQALDEEAQLKADLINKETQRLKLQKALTAEVTTAVRENNAEQKAISDKKAADDKERKDKQAKEDKERKDKEAKEDKERKERQIEVDKIVGEAQQQIQLAQLDNAQRGFQLLAGLAGKNKGLQAAAIIGENAVGIAKQVISTQAANRAVDLKYALIPGGVALAAAEKSINRISLGIGVASSVAATAKALSALKSGGSAAGSSAAGGGGGTEPQAPSFNIVGASDTNQLADAIGGQTQQPVQAFVVANDVTTAQSLENNIVEGATL
tara:strand:+ start:1220 stop:2956 length:1737 start_codon:yes stop_codon:yes gene_type:complete